MGKASRQKRERSAAPRSPAQLLPVTLMGDTPVVETEAPDFPYIRVGVTPDLIDECFVIELDGPGPFRRAELRLHTTEVLDLQKKLSNAITDWMGLSTMRLVQLRGAGEDEGTNA